MQVLVRDNNVDQALKALKKKMQREGIFREMKLRGHYEKPSEKKAREKAEAVRRARKLARKKLQREGLLPMKPKVIPGAGGPGGRDGGRGPRPGRFRWRRRRIRWRRLARLSRSISADSRSIGFPTAGCKPGGFVSLPSLARRYGHRLAANSRHARRFNAMAMRLIIAAQ